MAANTEDLLTAYSIAPTLSGIVTNIAVDLALAGQSGGEVYTESALDEIENARGYLDRIETIVRAEHERRTAKKVA